MIVYFTLYNMIMTPTYIIPIIVVFLFLCITVYSYVQDKKKNDNIYKGNTGKTNKKFKS
jgi:hypothetical protein